MSKPVNKTIKTSTPRTIPTAPRQPIFVFVRTPQWGQKSASVLTSLPHCLHFLGGHRLSFLTSRGRLRWCRALSASPFIIRGLLPFLRCLLSPEPACYIPEGLLLRRRNSRSLTGSVHRGRHDGCLRCTRLTCRLRL